MRSGEKSIYRKIPITRHTPPPGPEDWEDQIKFFCADFTVLAPTLRGHDGNNYKNRPMSIEQLSNDCVKILNTKSFNKVIIAGHSMGTRLAVDIASKIKSVDGYNTLSHLIPTKKK